MKDELGVRMKSQYELRARTYLPRRTYTIIRLDGKAFHSYTKGFDRPYDRRLVNAMDMTAIALCKEISGCKFAYVQSDEISLLLTDFENNKTNAWFDGNVQKMTSVSSSIATFHFNANLSHPNKKHPTDKPACFDSRVFTIPDSVEVENYFIWRQQDCIRNSIQMTAQSMFSHNELNGKNTSVLQDMMHSKGTNWNDMHPEYKRGRIIEKEMYTNSEDVLRSRWVSIPAYWFTKERDVFEKLIPQMHATEAGTLNISVVKEGGTLNVSM